MNFDTILRGATVIDGTGRPAFIADVGISGETIAAVGDLSATQAAVEVDAVGLTLTPGFIDAHTHSDAFLLFEPLAPSKLMQGVTTEIGGQCGGSAAPRLNGARLPSDWEAQTYPPRPGRETRGPNWDTVADYRSCFEQAKPAVNFILFAGHNTLRKGVMGDAPRRVTAEEQRQMERNLTQALEEGAWGMTTGLVYHPGVHSAPEEVMGLARCCAAHGGYYATHMRSEGDSLLEAIDEVLSIVRETGIRTEISHLKTGGKANWHKLPAALEKIERARAEGAWLHADRYPYLSSGTDLDIVLPDWASAGGNAAILLHLDHPEEAKQIAKALDASGRDPASIMIGGTWSEATKPLSGLRMDAVMARLGRSFGECIVWILQHDCSRTGAFFFTMSQANMETILAQPWVMAGSDASLRAPWGALGQDYPHPRAYGTHPEFFRVLTQTLRQSPEEAIRRMTGLPAEAFDIPRRGFIREGYAADLVLLDLPQWQAQSTYAAPHQFATGVRAVWVNGTRTTLDATSPRNGHFLTRD